MAQHQSDPLSFQLRRKHKLLRALDSPSAPGPCPHPRQHLLLLLQRAKNKEDHISQLNYFIKHQFDCDLTPFAECLVQVLADITNNRSGAIAAFLAYRLARKFTGLYWKIYEATAAQISDTKWSVQWVVFYTNLYLCGFPFTLQDFTNQIFPHFKAHLITLLPKYHEHFNSSLYFPAKQQKIYKNSLGTWLAQEKQQLIQRYESIHKTSINIQMAMAREETQEAELEKYESQLEQFQTSFHRFALASACLDLEVEAADFKLKPIFELKKECQHFKTSFVSSVYEQSLYESHLEQTISPLKKHEMLKLWQSEAFINQIKVCTSVQECLNLSGYFLEQMNLQKNREYLIETIIDYCHHYNNLSYILKIVFQISQKEHSLRDYCQSKARKICGVSRMNQKYLKLMCEMTRFKLMDEDILLDYCERMLKNENSQVTKEVESILQQLGALVYYRSLPIHIRFNTLLQRIQTIIKNRLTQFTTQHLYHVRSLTNFLRNHNTTHKTTTSSFMDDIQIKDNFDFILNNMQKLIKNQQREQVMEYIVQSIDREEYLTSYFYASLVRELDNVQLEKDIHETAMNTIRHNLQIDNPQKAVIWSRFLGELYNYQSISRKEFLHDLSALLQQLSPQQLLVSGCLKCICSALETTKTYLKPTNPKKLKELITLLLEIKIVYLHNKGDLEHSLNCEVQDILEAFHPQLTQVLNLPQEITYFVKIINQSEKNASKIDKWLDELSNGMPLDQLLNHQMSDTSKKRFKEKETEKTIKKWTQKNVPNEAPRVEHPITIVNEFFSVPENESLSKDQLNTLESCSSNAPVKKMKFMGRSKKDNKVKTISCTIEEQPRQA